MYVFDLKFSLIGVDWNFVAFLGYFLLA